MHHMDPIMLPLTGMVLVILLMGFTSALLRQPSVVAYLLAGVLLGPSVLGLVSDEALAQRIGNIGVLLLMFFLGMEMSPRKLLAGWRVAVLGTMFQILASLAAMWGLGYLLGWNVGQIVLLGFVIALSSTAVVINYLQGRGELTSREGSNALLVLLAQDIALIGMLIVLGTLGGESVDTVVVVKQAIGGVVLGTIMVLLGVRDQIRLPLPKVVRDSHELQLFVALLLCFSLALFAGLMELSTALGAFVAGMIVGVARETHWVHEQLEPLRVIFISAFFVSVGMLLDLDYIISNLLLLVSIVVMVLALNTLINAIAFRFLRESTYDSLVIGATLAQLGEFGFILAAVGFASGLVSNEGYQFVLAVIGISLVLAPAWIGLTKKLAGIWKPPVLHAPDPDAAPASSGPVEPGMELHGERDDPIESPVAGGLPLAR